MPLSDPLPSGQSQLGGGALLARFPLVNTTTSAITYGGASYDDINDRILVGSTLGVVFSKSVVDGKFVRSPTSPAIGASACQGLVVNRRDGGALFSAPNNLFRSDSALDNWVDITPPAAVTRRGVFSMLGSSRIYSVARLVSPPSRNIEFSDDNGVTWDSNPGLFAPLGVGADPQFIRSSRDGALICIAGFAGVGTHVVSTSTPDNNASWTQYAETFFTGNISYACFSDDNTILVVGDNNANIGVAVVGSGIITQIPIAANALQTTSIIGPLIDLIEFLPSLGGFIISGGAFGSGATTFSRAVGFLAQNDLTQITQGFYLGDSAPPGPGTVFGSGKSAVDRNGDMIWCGSNTNLGMAFVRFA